MNNHGYIFIDEGGNFDFSPGGTKYFTLTAISIQRPFNWNSPFVSLKYDLTEDLNLKIDCFHASEDKQNTRNKVFKIINSYSKHITVDTLIIEKSKTVPAWYDLKIFYPKMLRYLLKFVFSRNINNSRLTVITDRIPVNKKRNIVEKAIKENLSELDNNIPYSIFNLDSKSCFELQIVDYCNWAIFKKWKENDHRSYNLIKHMVRSEFDIFRYGDKHFY